MCPHDHGSHPHKAAPTKEVRPARARGSGEGENQTASPRDCAPVCTENKVTRRCCALVRKEFSGTSLLLQWLRLHTPSARGPGFDPWSGD